MSIESGSRKQCCDYLEEEYLNLIAAAKTNRSDLINMLLAAYFDGYNDKDTLKRKIVRGEADVAIWKMQLKEIEEHQGGESITESFKEKYRDELWNGYLVGDRFGKELSFNLNWLGGPGMQDKVRLAGFRSSDECLKWLEKKWKESQGGD